MKYLKKKIQMIFSPKMFKQNFPETIFKVNKYYRTNFSLESDLDYERTLKYL